jgi:hypothetical protein
VSDENAQSTIVIGEADELPSLSLDDPPQADEYPTAGEAPIPVAPLDPLLPALAGRVLAKAYSVHLRKVCKACGSETILPVENPSELKCEIVDGIIARPHLYECLECLRKRVETERAEQERLRAERIAQLPERERERKFLARNGFTQEDWHKRVDALGWKCSECGCELTKEPKQPNSVVRRSTDGSMALDKMIPVCRPCECKKVGPLANKQRCPSG